MGEKIKDLDEIKIGDSTFTIELNEGYTKNEGKLIHIQNKHYRYLLKQKDFINLMSTILRAKNEMDFFKNKQSNKLVSDLGQFNEIAGQTENNVLNNLCKDFVNYKIDYRIIETESKFISIIINNNCYEKFLKYINSSKIIKQVIHPFGEKTGYSFLYQMKCFKMIEIDSIYIEFFFQLPCFSLTEKTWIPLDKEIQKNLWNNNEKNDSNNYIIDSLSYSIYRICWAIFKRKYFNTHDKIVLNSNKEIINSKKSHELLEKVFFKYTEKIIELILNEQYELIIPEYYSFSDY